MFLFGIIIITNDKPEGNKNHFSHYYKSSLQSSAILAIRIEEVLKPSSFYQRYIGQVKRVNQKEVEGAVLIRVPNEELKKCLVPDELIYTSARLHQFSEPRNPGGFNFKEYYARRGVDYQLNLNKGQILRIKLKRWKIKTRALLLRERIIASLANQQFSEEAFSVIQALLLGKRQDLSEDTIRSYQDAGAMHLLAISGLHIGILVAILNELFKPLSRLKYARWIRILLLLLFLWTFAFLSGLSPSVIRAVSMFSVLSLGMITRPKSRLSNYLIISLFISLIAKPFYLFDLGFQLSYIAVIAILEIAPRIKNLWIPKHKLLHYFWNLFVISFAAQLGVLPLCLYYFHHMSGLFWLSSLIIIPFLGVILSLGYIMILLDRLGFLMAVYVKAYDKMIGLMNHLIDTMAKLELLVFKQVFFSLPLLFMAYILLYFLTNWLKLRTLRATMSIMIGMLVFLGTLLWESLRSDRSCQFVVFQQYKKSLIIDHRGALTSFYSSVDQEDSSISRALQDYKLGHFRMELNESKQERNFFRVGKIKIMVIDHQAIDADFGFEPDIIVLINSPRINLERLLNQTKPSVIVADGSNYYSFKSLWENTAKSRGIHFYDTTEQGAFILSNPL